LKKIKIEHCDEGIPSTAIREIALLRELNHPGIVNLIDIVHGENKLYLVFEFFNLDMKKYLDRRGKPMTIQHTRSVLWQVLQGLLHCHQRRIMHRDLKPSNLLIDESETAVKIADFGLARSFGLPLKSYTHEVVTLWYRAPEVLLGSKVYSTAVDVWSIGCILYELAHRKPLFYGESEIGQIFKIFKCLGTPVGDELWQGAEDLPEMKVSFPKWRVQGNENLVKLCTQFTECPEAVDLLTQMMQLEPSRRITVKGALAHPFFAEFNSVSVPGAGNSMMLVQQSSPLEMYSQ
jgi:serine/threonine protein kinase